MSYSHGRSRWVTVPLVLVLAGVTPLNTFAAEVYPARPIRLVVPFSPGGAADVPVRLLSQRLSESLGQQIVVDNRPGAGSTMGAEIVAKARPDGYTLLTITAAHFVSAGMYPRLSYQSLLDFSPVTAFATSTYVLVVHPGLEVRSVKELITQAKAAPGKIDFASSGSGSLQHLMAALFNRMAGADMTHVPYKGSAPALTDVIGGRVKVSFASIVNVWPHMKSGRLIGLAVTSANRSVLVPDIPTVAEAGVPGYEATQWTGIAGPRALPAGIVSTLHAAIVQLSGRPDFSENLRPSGSEVMVQNTPALAVAFMQQESVKWLRLVKDSGARVDY